MRIVKRFFQFFKIDYDKLKRTHSTTWLMVDIFMIILIIFNLIWIIFEFSLNIESFRSVLSHIAPNFYDWYMQKINPNFFYYDLIFVGIYLTEVFVRWSIAIYRKTYSKWFFYPFVHWYDVLGCIPLSSFRALRLLRVFSMFYRLQRLGIIDLKSTFIYKQANIYISMLTEEVADRVVINVLSGVQDEVEKGSPIVDRIIKEVLLPKQHIISTWMANRMGNLSKDVFEKNEATFRRIIDDALTNAIQNNKDVARLKLIPGVGNIIMGILNDSVSDITFNTIKDSVEQLSDPQNNAGIVNDASMLLLEGLIAEDNEQDQSLDDFVSAITVDVIEVLKQEVAVQQWKIKEEERKAARQQKKLDKQNMR